LDHGSDKSGFDFAKYLIELDLDTNTMPKNFTFKVHSANSVGADNIRNILDNYLSFRKNNEIHVNDSP
jgi:hypothetical protein